MAVIAVDTWFSALIPTAGSTAVVLTTEAAMRARKKNLPELAVFVVTPRGAASAAVACAHRQYWGGGGGGRIWQQPYTGGWDNGGWSNGGWSDDRFDPSNRWDSFDSGYGGYDSGSDSWGDSDW